MAGRIRTIKPELREHLAFAQLTDRAARLFLMLYTIADDEGRCPASPSYLAGNVFFARPCGLNAIGKAIAELEAADLVKTYSVNKAPFIEIVGWRVQSSVTHQRIEKPQPGRFPAPEWFQSRNDSGNDSRTDSGTYQLPATATATSDSERYQRSLAEQASKQAVPQAAAAWRPPPGGKAEQAGADRVAAGELSASDVIACWEYCVEQEIDREPDPQRADRRALALIKRQKPQRANGYTQHDDANDEEEPWNPPR